MEEPPRSSTVSKVAAAIVGVAMLVIAGWVAYTQFGVGREERHAIQGFLSVTSDSIANSDSACWGTGGLSDLHDGTSVVIRDGDGKILAAPSLESYGPFGPGSCAFKWSADVPDRDVYQFTVSHRGDVTYSREHLESVSWLVPLSIGS